MAQVKSLKGILLIDDDDIHNFIFGKVLEQGQVEVTLHTCTSGPWGLEFLGTNSGPHEGPDMIFLDLFMPLMDGWQFLDEMEKLDLPARPPLFLLSSSDYGEDEDRARKHPAVTAFVQKPMTGDKWARLMAGTD